MQRAVCAGVVVGLVFIAGCGKSGPTKLGAEVKGRLVNNGQPIQLLKDETISVSFSPAPGSAGGATGLGEINSSEGAFEVSSVKGVGLPAGTYHIQISSSIYGGSGEDRFASLFPDPKQASNVPPLSVEIGAEPVTVVVDIGKRTVTKQ